MSDNDQKPKTHQTSYLVPTAPSGELGSAGAVAIASGIIVIEAKTQGYQEQAHASNTRRAYKADWEHFEAWCKLYGAQALPADPRLVARYLSAYAGVLSVATLGRRLSGIQFVHIAAELDFDRRERTLRDTWRGIRRTHGVASHGKAPTVTEELRALVSTLDLAKAIGIRDRALLLLGFAGCYRRSEIVSIDHEHVADHRDGLVISLLWSKTDQEGQGSEKGIPYGQHPETCPVRAVKDWIAAAAISEGPLFRPVTRHGHIAEMRLTDKGVARIVKRAVLAARVAAIANGNQVLAEHFDPKRYAGHSLRAGFITSAAAAGVATHDIMRQREHKRNDRTNDRTLEELATLYETETAVLLSQSSLWRALKRAGFVRKKVGESGRADARGRRCRPHCVSRHDEACGARRSGFLG